MKSKILTLNTVLLVSQFTYKLHLNKLTGPKLVLEWVQDKLRTQKSTQNTQNTQKYVLEFLSSRTKYCDILN